MSRPQLHVQIEEDNIYEKLCSCYLEGCYLYIWQSHVKIEGYSFAYLGRVAAPCHWLSVKGGANMCFLGSNNLRNACEPRRQWKFHTNECPAIRPPFRNLSLSTKRWGVGWSLYTGCNIFSHDYALPSSVPPTTSCPDRRRQHIWKTLQLLSGRMLFIHLAVPCKNWRLFLRVFGARCCALSLTFC